METKFYHLIVLKSGDKFAVDIIYESKVYNLWGLTCKYIDSTDEDENIFIPVDNINHVTRKRRKKTTY
jgi:hypothetical protein